MVTLFPRPHQNEQMQLCGRVVSSRRGRNKFRDRKKDSGKDRNKCQPDRGRDKDEDRDAR